MSKPFKKKSLWKELWEYVKMILFVVIVVLVVDNFLLINAVIPSESMENTIMTGDRIFGNRLAYLFDDPERFDIVIFKMKVRDLSKGLSVCQGKPWKSGKERCISMVRIRLWMTALPLKPLWETLDHTLYRRVVISCWGTTGIIPGIPVCGTIPM